MSQWIATLPTHMDMPQYICWFSVCTATTFFFFSVSENINQQKSELGSKLKTHNQKLLHYFVASTFLLFWPIKREPDFQAFWATSIM
jgi:hypothetical protein